MFDLIGPPQRLCDRLSRRAMLRVGGLASLGVTLPGLLASTRAADDTNQSRGRRHFGKAKRCLMLYMWGGPSHIDLYDLKPDAPVEYRGPFNPIRTATPGFRIGELMPQLAKHTDKLGLIRSVTHTDNNHSTGAHWMLTGRKHERSAENFNARQTDFPHIGSVLSKLAPVESKLPTFVSLPEVIATTAGAVTPGQGGGILGRRYDPFSITEHPDKPDFKVPNLTLPNGLSRDRMRTRVDLLKQFDRSRRLLDTDQRVADLGAYQQQAVNLVTSRQTYEAFNLDAEPDTMRDAYGRGTFGQSLLLARRLLESGVKLVTVYWHRDKPGVDTTWDTHKSNFKQLKNRLVPQVDQPLATMFDDLKSRGMLDDTLVIWTSEFGRTPKINKNDGGRDHWGPCNSVWLAGAGVPGGQVYGESDKHAAYPKSDPVTPGDLTATIYHLLGLKPDSVIYDRLERPLPIAEGEPLWRFLQA